MEYKSINKTIPTPYLSFVYHRIDSLRKPSITDNPYVKYEIQRSAKAWANIMNVMKQNNVHNIDKHL